MPSGMQYIISNPLDSKNPDYFRLSGINPITGNPFYRNSFTHSDWEQLPSLKQSHKHSIPVCFYYTDSGKALHSQSAVYAFVYLRYNKNKRGRIIFSVEFLSCLFFISIRRPIPRKISAWSKDRNSKVSRGAARPLAGRIQRNRRFRGTRLSRKV